jgi:drug/metabolite transporter (DMT)-like permease
VFGWLLGISRVTTLDILGLLLAICGTLLLVPTFSLEDRQTAGLAVGILSGTMAALLPLLHQKHVAVDVHLRTWGQFVVALGLFCCFWPYARWEFRLQDTAGILYLGLVVAWIGHGLWIRISTLLSTTSLAILTYLYLPLSLIVSFLTLGEKLSGRMLLGTLFVLVANAMVLWHQIRNRTLHANLPEPT